MRPDYWSFRIGCVMLALASYLGRPAGAFQLSKPISSSTIGARRSAQPTPTALDVIKVKKPDPFSYAEQSRLYRRDFYDHDAWLKHRAKNRFVGTIAKMFESGVIRQLADEIFLIGAVATFVCLFNSLCVVGYEDFQNVHHDPIFIYGAPLVTLPGEPFSLSSPALSLLLGTFGRECSLEYTFVYIYMDVYLILSISTTRHTVFKTNTSYQRWDEARKAWGVIVNNSRTVIRESSAWILQTDIPDSEKYRLIHRIAECVWLFPRSLQRHLLNPAEDEEAYVKAVRQRLPPALAEDMVRARHRPTRAMYEMSKAVNTLPLDSIRRSTVDQAVSQLCDACGGCERIFGSPVPSIYTRHAARFLELWIFFLPLALWTPFEFCWNHWFMIPSSMIIGFFLLGIEELAIQLEEPFSVLPLGKIASGIGLSAEEHVQWAEQAMERERTATTDAPPYYR
jgi:ion channel-forming bestrophin family protein